MGTRIMYGMSERLAIWPKKLNEVACQLSRQSPTSTLVRGSRRCYPGKPVDFRKRSTQSLVTQALRLSLVVVTITLHVVVSDAHDGPSIDMAKSVHEEGGQVKVYVYDDPVFDQTDLIQCYREKKNGISPWQDEQADMVQDMGEIWLHQSLLLHEWRVSNPEDADVFYIPLYPVLSAKVLEMPGTPCEGRSHNDRITAALTHLDHKSTYFKRFGGADHVIICAWWNCKVAFTPMHRMLMRRVVIGVNEANAVWLDWGCSGKMVTVPYTATSVMTTQTKIGGNGAEERDIPFFFSGTSRRRIERLNLEVVLEMYPESVIELGNNGKVWSENATMYANNIARSRFCFCPRGDTESSRRLFDAVAAGCIPVLSSPGSGVLPFLESGLNYSEFAVVAPLLSFTSREGVAALVGDLFSRSNDQLASLQRGVQLGRRSIIYGVTTGPTLRDMHPFMDVSSSFLRETASRMGRHVWSCPPVSLDRKRLAPRTLDTFPPARDKRERWLVESETIINEQHSVLFCAPRNTGSVQFRMLAKRMQDLENWAVSDNTSLLFDPASSALPLLNVSDGDLMEKIYADNGSGWIKVGIVRDPVTRFLSAYLDLVCSGGSDSAWFQSTQLLRPNNSSISSSSNNNGETRRRLSHEDTQDEERVRRLQHKYIEGSRGDHMRRVGRNTLEERNKMADAERIDKDATGREGGGHHVVVPTLEEVVNALETSLSKPPVAFRPMSSLCGMQQSPFDTIIPFETLQKTSTEVLKSLPGGVWDTYGASGWGPDGDLAFMEFDYGSSTNFSIDSLCAPSIPRRARDLFDGDSCEWTKYYTNRATLERVRRFYADDYDLFGWYDLGPWIERFDTCLRLHKP